MSPEAKDKLILFIGSLGWVLAGVFIILFFVMLRPSDYRSGYDLGRQTQQGVDALKLDSYLDKPLAEGLWVGGIVSEIREDALILELEDIRTNPLRNDGPVIQELPINQTPVYQIIVGGNQQSDPILVAFSDIQVGDFLRYDPIDRSNALDAIAQAKEVQFSRIDPNNQIDTENDPIEPIGLPN